MKNRLILRSLDAPKGIGDKNGEIQMLFRHYCGAGTRAYRHVYMDNQKYIKVTL